LPRRLRVAIHGDGGGFDPLIGVQLLLIVGGGLLHLLQLLLQQIGRLLGLR
jgi:hypothetical protein